MLYVQLYCYGSLLAHMYSSTRRQCFIKHQTKATIKPKVRPLRYLFRHLFWCPDRWIFCLLFCFCFCLQIHLVTSTLKEIMVVEMKHRHWFKIKACHYAICITPNSAGGIVWFQSIEVKPNYAVQCHTNKGRRYIVYTPILWLGARVVIENKICITLIHTWSFYTSIVFFNPKLQNILQFCKEDHL